MDALVSVFLELVKISLTAGMIAGIILLIRAVIGKKFPRRVCYALWGVVLIRPVSYTHLRAHETRLDVGCRLGV